MLHSITCSCKFYNEPRIGDSGGLENLNFQSCTYLSNSLLLFSKFMKKRKYKRLLRQKKEKLSISPLNRHFANTMLSGNPFGLPAQRSRRLTESSPTGLSSNTRLAQLRQHVRQAPATLSAVLL